ncbi:LTA synthase family protein [Jeotgalibacillus campisalis]|uniref:Phosphoglycerol transferase n=1 Tax=Jeotgalibacillus campisalis TaxID=220754 RepID=A0A0C2SG23_9BACL|nr:LTA synthase family protein [Jeotgalibacillus campisalis]KIL52889.1 phosphoglycerol transferase [Jeotgalibacillus campisalis]
MLKNSYIWIAVSCLWIKTLALSFVGFNLRVQTFLDVILIIINPLGPLMLLVGLSFYWNKKIKLYPLFVIMFLITGLLYGDLLYYRFYTDFVTVPILFQFSNVGGLGPSTLELLSWWDLLLFADLLLVGWLIARKKMTSLKPERKAKRNYLIASIALMGLTVGLGLVNAPHLFAESYNREQMVKNIGPFQYHAFDIGVAANSSLYYIFAESKDAAKIIENTQASDTDSDSFGIAEGKNVILISMESTQGFVINQKVNGEELTPFLNSLIDESYYFSSIYDQTAQGKTSDSEFMIDTGLYPMESGAVFVRKTENTFIGLPHILKQEGDYYSAVFHGNDPTFWNRENMYESLGYDHFYAKESYKVTEENSVNYGIKDVPFFEQSVSIMEELPQPYYARFITLTNHFPFLLEQEDQFIDEAETEEGVVNRYITTIRYQDEAIRLFFEQLKEKGLYENTIFVLYGDHYGISEKYDHGVMDLLNMKTSALNRMKLKQVPLIIHVPGQEGKTFTRNGGEIDIRPTLLHLMGIHSEEPSLGKNLFARSNDHPVIFRNGDFVTDKYLLKDKRCYSLEKEELTDAHHCEPTEEIVREELEMSDEIIYGDLLRFIE